MVAYKRTSHGRAVQQAAKHRFGISRFGITPEQYAKMLEAQGGFCAICKEKCATGRRLAVDHCHATGKVRALLCTRCNQTLGKFEHFREAAELYLKEYGDGNPLVSATFEDRPSVLTRPGWKPANTKLTAVQVQEIRARYDNGNGGISQRKLAIEYGMSPNQVGRIVRGLAWTEEVSA